ncbi:hypothetical protein EXIGLDRAFT_774596 [Exidia glandulosa HHB12029]|uniref:Uncharacterized protein n=1 Tax=Exidia glandulosa HHB12029 TaxID=1314781 RepID=A0A165EAY0_EXIGL|nr:hypothetical protein EXIGLDRAFT_774596 [Exidia glandulosa HHB12029]
MISTSPSLIYEVGVDTEANITGEYAYDYATNEADVMSEQDLQSTDTTSSAVTSHPIQRLPVEPIILIVPHAAAGSTGSSPFAIASSCHPVREITLHTPKLWSMVYCTTHDFSLIGSEERYAGLLTIQLSRSSALPLDVFLALYTKALGSLWPSILALSRRAQRFRLCIGHDLYGILSSQSVCQNAQRFTHLELGDRDSPFLGDERSRIHTLQFQCDLDEEFEARSV